MHLDTRYFSSLSKSPLQRLFIAKLAVVVVVALSTADTSVLTRQCHDCQRIMDHHFIHSKILHVQKFLQEFLIVQHMKISRKFSFGNEVIFFKLLLQTIIIVIYILKLYKYSITFWVVCCLLNALKGII